MTGAEIIFYDWPHSPFCMKVRAVLDHKGLAYRAVDPLRHVAELRRRGAVGKVPALDIDGELIFDSTDIAHAIDARWPDPPLFPADPRERALCHAIEEWADEALYFIGLHWRWQDAEGRAPVAGVFGRSVKGRLAYRFYLRRILGQLRGQGTGCKSAAHIARDMERSLDAAEALVTPGPYVLGERAFLCDFALWGQLEYLRRTPAGGRAMAGREELLRYLQRFKAPRGGAAR